MGLLLDDSLFWDGVDKESYGWMYAPAIISKLREIANGLHFQQPAYVDANQSGLDFDVMDRPPSA